MVGQIRFAFVPDDVMHVSSTTSTSVSQEYTPIDVVVALTFTVGLILVRCMVYRVSGFRHYFCEKIF